MSYLIGGGRGRHRGRRWLSSVAVAPAAASLELLAGTPAVSSGGASIAVAPAAANLTLTGYTPVVLPWFLDGFETGDKSHSTNGFRWGVGTAVVSSSVAYRGTHALRFAYPASTAGQDSSRDQRFTLAEDAAHALTAVWIEFWLRVPLNIDDYLTRAQSEHSSGRAYNNELCSFWSETGDSTSAETSLDWAASSDFTEIYIQPVTLAGTATNNGQTPTLSASAPIFRSEDAGSWVRMRIYIKARCQNEVNLRVWQDDRLVAEVRNFNTTLSGGLGYFRSGYLFGWSNSGFSAATDFYVDEVKVITAEPGWIVPGSTIPLYSTDFSNGLVAANGFSWAALNHTQVDSVVVYPGTTKSLHFMWHMQSTGKLNANAEQRFHHPQVTEYWVEFYIYYPLGNESDGNGGTLNKYAHIRVDSANNNKFFSFWTTGGYSTAPDGVFQTWANADEVPNDHINVARTDASYTGSGSNFRYAPPNPRWVASDADRGRWIRVGIHIKISEIGAGNGILQLWKDGQLWIDLQDQSLWDYSDPVENFYWAHGYLQGWRDDLYGGRSDVEQDIFIAKFSFYTSNPGW